MLESTLSDAAIYVALSANYSIDLHKLVVHTCGTHFGATNDPASIVCKPVDANRLTSSILVSAGMLLFSFCSPSRGPTSMIRTWSARTRLELVKVRFERCLYARRPKKLGGKKDMMRKATECEND